MSFVRLHYMTLVDWESWWLRKLKHEQMQDKEFWKMQSSQASKGRILEKVAPPKKQKPKPTNHQKTQQK